MPLINLVVVLTVFGILGSLDTIRVGCAIGRTVAA